MACGLGALVTRHCSPVGDAGWQCTHPVRCMGDLPASDWQVLGPGVEGGLGSIV